jgi:hypothetical protein
MASPAELEGRQRLALQRIDDVEVPTENVDGKLAVALANRVQKRKQRGG